MPITEKDLEDPGKMVELLNRLESQQLVILENAGRSSVNAKQDMTHEPGLCGSMDCTSCVAQAKQIADHSFKAGQDQAVALFEQSVILVGGKPLLEELTTKMAQARQAAQTIVVTG